MSEAFEYKGTHIARFTEAFNALKEEDETSVALSEAKIVLLTHTANITGEIIDLDEAVAFSESQLLAATVSRAIRDSIREEHEMNTPENAKVIHLKNATVTPFAAPDTKMTYYYLAVYTDQIVGISFGDYM